MSDLLSYLVNNRPLQLHSELPPGMLLAADFAGVEQISSLYRFEANLLTPRPLAVDFEKILGKPVSLELRPQSSVARYFHGLVSRFSEGRRDEHFTHYRAEIVPKFWLWTQQQRCRVFQRRTVPEILAAVFDGLDVRFQLTATYEPREYCVQYQESDFAFASRLMEAEGIYYFFEHRVDGHTLVVADSHFQLADVPGPAQVRFDELEGGVVEELRVHRWEKSQRVCTAQFTLWDYNFQMPDDHLEAQQQLLEQISAGLVQHKLSAADPPLERYEYPGGYGQHFDGINASGGDESADLSKIFEENQRIARVRMQAEATAALWTEGASNCAQFLPGHHFTLLWHGSGDGQYLLTRVEHQAQLDLSYRSDDTPRDLKYENRFTCVPGDTPFRPQRTTLAPRIVGFQTATVVGPSGDPLFLDKYGRVKVQFHWDRQGRLDANSSCWVRVAQSWAGNRWGAFFWPRLGQEVVVAFEEGNPDRPLIVGSVYNADNMPPFELPDNSNLGGIRSCTLSGNGTQTFNTLVFDDRQDDEHILLHSENHVHVSSESANYQYAPTTQLQVIGSFPFGSGGGGGKSKSSRKRPRSKSSSPFGASTMPPGTNASLGLPPEYEALMQHVLGPQLVQEVSSLRGPQPERRRPPGPVFGEETHSGLGGGLWDFPAGVAAGGGGSEAFREFFETQMPSSFGITSGDSVSVFLRDNIQRFWSAKACVVADIQEIIIGGVLGEVCPAASLPVVETVFGGLFGFGGNLGINIGGTATMNYGPAMSVLRGESVSVNQHGFMHLEDVSGLNDEDAASATLLTNAARFLVVMTVIGSLICDIMLRIKCVPTPSTNKCEASEFLLFLYNSIYSRVLGILKGLEGQFAELQKELNKLSAAAKDAAQADAIVARADASATTIASKAIDDAERRLVLNTPNAHTRNVSGNYTLNAAGDINLLSSVPAGNSSITIRAEGAATLPGIPGLSGTLNLVGTKAATLSTGGDGGVRITGNPLFANEVMVDGGLTGTAKMVAGVPDFGPRIELDVVNGSWQCGLEGLGSCINLGVESLSISCGPPGEGAAIRLTPMSVQLQLGENIWTLSPAGMSSEALTKSSLTDVSDEQESSVVVFTGDSAEQTLAIVEVT